MLATMLAPCPGWSAFGVAEANGGTVARRYQLDRCPHLVAIIECQSCTSCSEKEEKH
jgi:hypothetical protein